MTKTDTPTEMRNIQVPRETRSIREMGQAVQFDGKVPDGEHVTILFADGELVSTKGGSLLWQRTLHQIGEPLSQAPNRWAFDFFPELDNCTPEKAREVLDPKTRSMHVFLRCDDKTARRIRVRMLEQLLEREMIWARD